MSLHPGKKTPKGKLWENTVRIKPYYFWNDIISSLVSSQGAMKEMVHDTAQNNCSL